ncbi:MAG: hypothetical protein MHMPM18_000073 [Marteilia pararefringens]
MSLITLIINLSYNGRSDSTIAQLMSLSRSTVATIVRKYNLEGTVNKKMWRFQKNDPKWGKVIVISMIQTLKNVLLLNHFICVVMLGKPYNNLNIWNSVDF